MGAASASTLECVARDRGANSSSAQSSSARGGTARPPQQHPATETSGTNGNIFVPPPTASSGSATSSQPPPPARWHENNGLSLAEQWNEQVARMRRLFEDQHLASSGNNRLGPTFGVASKDLAKLLPGHSELLKQVLRATQNASTTDEEATGLLLGMAKALYKVAEGVQATSSARSPNSTLIEQLSPKTPPRSPTKLDVDSWPLSVDVEDGHRRAASVVNGGLEFSSERSETSRVSTRRAMLPAAPAAAPSSSSAAATVNESKALTVLDGIFMHRQNEGYASKVAATLLERHMGSANPPDAQIIVWSTLQDIVESLCTAWDLSMMDARLMQRIFRRAVFSDSLDFDDSSVLGCSRSSMSADFDESGFVLTVGAFKKTFPRAIQRVWRRYRPSNDAKKSGTSRRSFLRSGSRVNFDDKYTVKMEMGSGSFGSVALCIHKMSGCLRAVKTIPRSNLEGDKEDVYQEFKVLAYLDHPNIVRVFEVVEDTDKVYICMDAVLGGNMKEAILAFSASSANKEVVDLNSMEYIEAWTSTVMVQLFKAVQYCHARGIVHCDLKPQNVLMMPTSIEEPPRSVICDFGIADVARTHNPDSSNALTGLKGTPSYMAPETFLGSGSGVKSDIWSLGVILFEAISRGSLPFKADNILLISKKICYDEPNWAMVDSEEARAVCQMLLRKVEIERPSASEALASCNLWAKTCTWTWTCLPTGSASIATWSQVNNIPQKLHDLHRRSHLEHCVLACIGSQMNMAQLGNLSVAFEKYDKDHSGFLDHAELTTCLRDFGIDEDEAKIVARELDTDHSGTVDYSEFVAGCLSVREEFVMKQLRVAFSIFDLDGNGLLDRHELFYALTNHGIIRQSDIDSGAHRREFSRSASASGESGDELGEDIEGTLVLNELLGDGITLEELLDELDTSGDGKISYEEFQAYFRRPR